jgi:D-beta-D-heptose 7-phosphate kinase/D-beta-D-heptose 1-phosphate adenosyltransferase
MQNAESIPAAVFVPASAFFAALGYYPVMSTRLIELMEHLPPARIALVGDFMLDRYLFGKTGRISPEAPVPVLHFSREEQRLGGAGFVLAAMATLGAKVSAVGVLGNDPAGAEIKRQLGTFNVDCSGLLESDARPTVSKVRLLGASQDRTPQQMIRLDYEEPGSCDAATCEKILKAARTAIASADMLCLEDYNKGVLTPEVTREIIAMGRAARKPILVDPANLSDYDKYRGATALKLNRPEAERATGLPLRNVGEYSAAATKLLESLELEAVVITLNEQGAYLATNKGERRLLSTRPRQVADATGAGDQVLATLCLARAAGASWTDSVALANVASGIEVERLGCVPVTRDEIIHDLLMEHHEQAGKERTLGPLVKELDRHRAMGKRIVFTNGCFDIIHLGHVKYFQFAKSQGDLLVVAVNTDASIRRLKGANHPVIDESDRVGVLEEFQSIDYLVRFDDDTPMDLIHQIRPDVLVKGADYAKEHVLGWEFVESYGGRVALAPLIDGRSTSAVIERIVAASR